MKFLTPTLLATLPLIHATHSFVHTRRQTAPTTTPWSLSELKIRVPNHREGTYPWSTFTASITDPNTYNLNNSVTVSPSTGVNCFAKFLDLSSADEGPWGRSWACEDDGKGEGHWEMRISKTDSGYRVVFTHVAANFDKAALRGWSRKFEGAVDLVVGSNLKVSCAGEGTCGYWLARTPVEVVGREV
ncbi:hypothetical protein DM02DRAFT_54329 [Periconia macrospinosa]|uniref:Ubiquitin 3 binding protein But2 C-terminal domain-containing protein n=1 Tax=Periconia macrospinosa TaxID=97972 RepID=A0A2V1E5P3_9PLEO|nr:hypothetical protein DM02DRAFT_54329 [Periconia macrospinosa]